MKKYLFFTCIYLLLQFNLDAQISTNDESPAMEGEGHVSDGILNSNVELSTGSVSTGVHLMELQGGNGAKLSLNLNYQGGKGMKVTDVAGPYGTGFKLKGGGYVKRIVRGVPDEKICGVARTWQNFTVLDEFATGWLHSSPSSITSFRAPDYYRSVVAPAGVPNWEYRVGNYYDDVYARGNNQKHAVDGEPDLFMFDFGGFTGSFVFGNDGLPVLLPYQDLKLDMPFDFDVYGSSTVDSWVFTTPNGTRYEFSNADLYREVTDSYSYDPTVHGATETNYVTQWNLSSVTTSDGNAFNFTYEPGDISLRTDRFYIEEYVSGDQPNIWPPDYATDVILHTHYKKLKTIASDFGRIEFTDHSTPRLDFTDQYPVGNISRYNLNGDLQESVSFNYDSYAGTSCLDCKRLFLNELTFDNLTNAAESKRYSFQYYFNNEVPDITSTQQDLWGYWNENTTNNLVPSAGTYTSGGDRSISTTRAMVGMLKKVTFPTGGSREYFYECNDFATSIPHLNGLTGGVRVSRVIEHPEVSQNPDMITEYSYRDESDPTKSSGEVIPMRKLFDIQEILPPNDNTIYCTVGSKPRREMSNDWIRYNTVSVSQPGNGKTVYKLTSHSTNPDTPPLRYEFQPGVPLSNAYTQYIDDKDNDAGAPLTDMSYDRGLVKKVSIYDEGGNRLKETTYNYNFNPVDFRVQQVTALKISSDYDVFRAKNECLNWNLEYYKYISKLHVLVNKVLVEYDVANNLQLSKITNYEYNLSKHINPIEIKESNSDASIVSTKFTYPLDLSNAALMQGHSAHSTDPVTQCLRTMIDNHITANPIEVVTTIQKSADKYVTSGMLYLYESYARTGLSSIVKQSKIYQLEINDPVLNFQPSYLDASLNFIKDTRYALRNTYEKYDDRGNLIQESFASGIVSSYIYSKASPGMLSSIAYAATSNTILGNEASYTGFESCDNLDVDHWLENPVTNMFCAPYSHTGEKSYKILPGNVGPHREFRPDNQNQKYRFSCYIKTAAGFGTNRGSILLYTKRDNNTDMSNYPAVSGSYITVFFSDTQGEWQFVEGVIDLDKVRASSGISPTTLLRIRCSVNNNDAGHIVYVDDIRFQPYLSEMSYFNYDRISGEISSKTNDNSITTFYDYDGLNQLTFLSDNDHKVLKSYVDHFNHDPASGGYNYSTYTTFNAPHSIDDINNGTVNSSDMLRRMIYKDGLGRSIQNVIQGFTMQGNDLIQSVCFDAYGRKGKTYLPYTDGGWDGSFRPNSFNDQLSFFQNAQFVDHTSIPYSENVYDNSPKNQVVESGSPGVNWAIGSGHTEIRKVWVNDVGDNVKRWIKNGNTVYVAGNYYKGTLYKYYSADENGNETIIFKDKIGRIILERKSANCLNNGTIIYTSDETGVTNSGSSTGAHTFFDTYNVFNDKNQLAVIVPPAAIEQFNSMGVWSFTISDPDFQKYVFLYAYDKKNRCIKKKMPSQDSFNSYIYDKRNRLVMTQSPDQIVKNRWNYFKYDKRERVILSGTYLASGISNPSQMQLQIDQNPVYYENRIAGGILEYSNSLFPVVVMDNVLFAKYYDDYNWNKDGRNFFGFGTTTSNFNINYGLLTGQKERVLDFTTSSYLTTVNYYDNRLRLIQAHKKHILNDWDVWSNTFSFTDMLTYSTREHHLGNNRTTVESKYWYNHLNRLTDIFKYVSKSDGITTVSDNEIHQTYVGYNDLGKIIKKSLHYDWAGTAAYLQDVDYRYNVRGWLTNINNAELIDDGGITNSDDMDAFGESIYYDNCSGSDLSADPGTIQANPQFNGNISAIKWKVRSPYIQPTDAIEHMYAYRYDNLNRMTAGYYASDENVRGYINTRDAVNNFDEIVDYDLMGNVTALRRNNLLGEIDNLQYEYDGNRLINVTDVAAQQSKYDFHDVVNTTDYIYNENGAMMEDQNKQIRLSYNDLHLPASVDHAGETLSIIYGGSGDKLKRAVNSTTHYYISGIEYEDNGDGSGPKFLFITTEEGRIRPRTDNTIYPPASRSFVFDYFLKDHIGNVRAVISEEVTGRSYHATMEPANSVVENSIFNNINLTRADRPANEPIDVDYSPDNKVSKLGGSSGVTVGVAKVLKVKQGDRLDFETKYFFDNSTYSNLSYTISEFLTQVAGTFVFGPYAPGGMTVESQMKWSSQTFTSNPGINDFLNSAFHDQSINDPGKPQSYLIYMFFNDKFVFNPKASGVLQVRSPNQLAELGMLNLKMPENGFFYIYTNNESSKKVYFNNMTVNHYAGVLLEENHFYPYGLIMEGITPEASADGAINKYKFIGKEMLYDEGMNMYDLGARLYDPSIARFNVADPLADLDPDFSPYRYGYDNPVRYKDGTGLYEGDDGEDDPIGVRDACDSNEPPEGWHDSGNMLREVLVEDYAIHKEDCGDDDGGDTGGIGDGWNDEEGDEIEDPYIDFMNQGLDEYEREHVNDVDEDDKDSGDHDDGVNYDNISEGASILLEAAANGDELAEKIVERIGEVVGLIEVGMEVVEQTLENDGFDAGDAAQIAEAVAEIIFPELAIIDLGMELLFDKDLGDLMEEFMQVHMGADKENPWEMDYEKMERDK